jgi:hypothetical protein
VLERLKIDLANVAERRWRDLERQQQEWNTCWIERWKIARQHVDAVDRMIFQPAQRELGRKVLFIVPRKRARLRLTADQLALLNAQQAIAATDWLAKNCDGPAWHIWAELFCEGLLTSK